MLVIENDIIENWGFHKEHILSNVGFFTIYFDIALYLLHEPINHIEKSSASLSFSTKNNESVPWTNFNLFFDFDKEIENSSRIIASSILFNDEISFRNIILYEALSFIFLWHIEVLLDSV